ncbi:hypothetical protein ACPV30_02395 [Photobacterium damselae]
MAKIIYRSSIKDTPKALALLKESAKTNPYAAMALFPDNEQCQMYFPRECNEKWVEQAKILFSEDAKKGDVRAIFYSKMLKEDHDVYVDAIIEAAKNHYYYPLVDYSNYILNDKSSNVEMKNLALSLLNYARVNNFIPAIDSLIHFYENNEMDKGNDYIELIKQGVLYGSNYAWNMNETLFRINDKNSNMDKYIKGKALYDFNGRDIGLSFVKFINNNKELALANKKAQEMVDAVKDVIYIDGAHPRQD